ncbi:hypothetical protein [Streptomyces sp. NPDC096934]|uniref:hypothetical protein n=1 Tax=Streptomyces sp. NPDC096934 TaxID=3155551 RepID=UPI0033223BDC
MSKDNAHRKSEKEKSMARRAALGLGVAGVAGGSVFASQRLRKPGGHQEPQNLHGKPVHHSEKPARLIGDGSTSSTGIQPNRPTVRRLERAERPPQFVVVSWDGAGSLDDGLFERFRKVALDIHAHMTFFLSGIYLLPENKKQMYKPPMNPTGASDIGYLTDAHIRSTLQQVRLAWLEGHEIGTHFNGHFCSGTGSVANWSSGMWTDEIRQAHKFVTTWRTNTGLTDLDPLPFDYSKELVGGRTPCLLGQKNLLPAIERLGWRYDASSPGGLQVWPEKQGKIWNFPLQSVPFPDHSFEVLTMDYNMMANQSGASTNGNMQSRPKWREQAAGAYKMGFQRSYDGNRAPFFIGNHFEHWNGGIYMDAVEDFLHEIAEKPEVRLVSFKELCDWLDAQSPGVLSSLRDLPIGQPVNWKTVVN